jgi:hypothetical protein
MIQHPRNRLDIDEHILTHVLPQICQFVASGRPCPYGERCHFSHKVSKAEDILALAGEEMSLTDIKQELTRPLPDHPHL